MDLKKIATLTVFGFLVLFLVIFVLKHIGFFIVLGIALAVVVYVVNKPKAGDKAKR